LLLAHAIDIDDGPDHTSLVNAEMTAP